MRNQTHVVQSGRHPNWPQRVDAPRIAMDETELATRWNPQRHRGAGAHDAQTLWL